MVEGSKEAGVDACAAKGESDGAHRANPARSMDECRILLPSRTESSSVKLAVQIWAIGASFSALHSNSKSTDKATTPTPTIGEARSRTPMLQNHVSCPAASRC
jgi:hypothetical protein